LTVMGRGGQASLLRQENKENQVPRGDELSEEGRSVDVRVQGKKGKGGGDSVSTFAVKSAFEEEGVRERSLWKKKGRCAACNQSRGVGGGFALVAHR